MGELTWGDVFGGLALLGTLIGWILNRRAAKAAAADAKKADERADRAAGAAERSADAQERLAQLFSEFLTSSEREAAGVPETGAAQGVKIHESARQRSVHWTVEREKGQRYTLVNLGGTARNVRLRSENALSLEGPQEPVDTMSTHDSISFVAFGSWQTGTPALIVTWQDEDGTPREWRRVLP